MAVNIAASAAFICAHVDYYKWEFCKLNLRLGKPPACIARGGAAP